MPGRGGRKVRKIVSSRGRSGQRNSSRSNNRNKSQELTFYLHETGSDLHTATFTKVKEHLILKIQSESVNRSDIAELICKGEILYLSKKIVIKSISTEDEPIREELVNEYFKAM